MRAANSSYCLPKKRLAAFPALRTICLLGTKIRKILELAKEMREKSEADATRLYQSIFEQGDGNLVPQGSASESNSIAVANLLKGVEKSYNSGNKLLAE